MFRMFQQINPHFDHVPHLFRNTPREQEQEQNTFRNTPNKPLTSKNTRNTFRPTSPPRFSGESMPTTTSGRFGKRYNDILRFITEQTTPSEVAAHFDLDQASVYTYLSRMVRRGDLHRPHRGIYTPTN